MWLLGFVLVFFCFFLYSDVCFLVFGIFRVILLDVGYLMFLLFLLCWFWWVGGFFGLLVCLVLGSIWFKICFFFWKCWFDWVLFCFLIRWESNILWWGLMFCGMLFVIRWLLIFVGSFVVREELFIDCFVMWCGFFYFYYVGFWVGVGFFGVICYLWLV